MWNNNNNNYTRKSIPQSVSFTCPGMARRPLSSMSQVNIYGTFTDCAENSETFTESQRAEWVESTYSKKPGLLTYDSVICFVLLINFLIGNGFLALPYALYQAGLLYGVITLLAVTFLSYISSMWTLEVMSRAQAIEYNKPAEAQVNPQSINNKEKGKEELSPQSPSYLKPVPTYEVLPKRKFEFVELCDVFLGRTGQIIYVLSLTSFLIFTCWAYSTVVGTTLSSSVPWHPVKSWRLCTSKDFRTVYIPEDAACRNTYWFYVGLFTLIVLPLSCLDIKKQHYFQGFTTAFRLMTVTIMIGESIFDITEGKGEMSPPDSTTNKTKTDYHAKIGLLKDLLQMNSTVVPSGPNVDPLKFCFVWWLWCIPVFLESQVVQQSIPALVYTLRKPNKLGKAFFYTFIFSTILDVIFGVSVAWRFGHNVAENAALNWVDQRNSKTPRKVVFAYIVSFLPSLDIISLFPMLVVTLANNLFVLIMGTDTSLQEHDISTSSMVLRKKVVLRLVVALISVGGSFAVSNLFYVSKYGGISGALIGILFPALLQYKSKEQCRRIFGTPGIDSRTEIATGNGEFCWVTATDSRTSLSSLLSSNPIIGLGHRRVKSDTPYSTVFSSNICVIVSSLFALGMIFCTFTLYLLSH